MHNVTRDTKQNETLSPRYNKIDAFTGCAWLEKKTSKLHPAADLTRKTESFGHVCARGIKREIYKNNFAITRKSSVKATSASDKKIHSRETRSRTRSRYTYLRVENKEMK